ncbi:MAG: DUF805 domain-containing protein [Tepidibacter sp.]|uniref:DUF805 domain-containing protein n=1 Tax=Tepidibacter sp. TaxID=2529387 RepID=UPI0025CBBDF0|nr:DUF805 domain-containing protein [Tepidibacter sp.]MCT4507827.1 DUF805 domain-containing protein [Tepidibacter sp.]
MHRFFSLKGRLSRGLFIGHIFAVTIFFIGLTALYPHRLFGYNNLDLLHNIINKLNLLSITCLIIQRLHDLNKSSLHALLLLIPIYNIFLILCILFKRGTVGPNEYGEDPLSFRKIF